MSAGVAMGEMTLAEKVRTRREELGLSRGELARKADVSESQVRLVEDGTTGKLQGNTLARYARALGVTSNWLRGVETVFREEVEVALRAQLSSPEHIEYLLTKLEEFRREERSQES